MGLAPIVRKLFVAIVLAAGASFVTPTATLQAQGCTPQYCDYAGAFDCYYSITCGQYGAICLDSDCGCIGPECWCDFTCQG